MLTGAGSPQGRKLLISTGLCESGKFSTRFRDTHPRRFFALSGHPPPAILRAFGTPLQVVRQVKDLQVVRTTRPVDKIKRTKTPEHRRKSPPGRVAQRSGFATIRCLMWFQGLRRCETVLQHQFDWRYLCAARFRFRVRHRPRRLPQQDRFVWPRDRLSRTSDYFMSSRKLRAKLVEGNRSNMVRRRSSNSQTSLFPIIA